MDRTNFPALYRSADEHSLKSQKLFFRALGIQLFLLVAAAAISAISEATKVTAYSQGLILAASLGCSGYLFMYRPDRKWYSARAVAESIKTISWRFMVRAEPFDTGDRDAANRFTSKLQQIVEQNQEVTKHFTRFLAGKQITDYMANVRSSTTLERKALYQNERVLDQLNWYEQKTVQNDNASRRAFCIMVIANALAIIFALLRPEFLKAAFWPTDVMVTFAATVLTWTQTRRYAELATSYALAAHEINIINEQLAMVSSDEVFSAFVSDAENAFSREHTQWTARKDR